MMKSLHQLMLEGESDEWWQSCDSSEEKYRATVEKFKAKWFREDRTRLKGYIDEIEILERYVEEWIKLYVQNVEKKSSQAIAMMDFQTE